MRPSAFEAFLNNASLSVEIISSCCSLCSTFGSLTFWSSLAGLVYYLWIPGFQDSRCREVLKVCSWTLELRVRDESELRKFRALEILNQNTYGVKRACKES